MGNMSDVIQTMRHRIDVHAFHKMADAGVFGEDDAVELIDGEIIDMAPIGSRHAFVVNRLAALLTLAVKDNALVSVQNPLRLGDKSEPQPDIAVLKQGDYMDCLPGALDVHLVVEVTQTSAEYDRGVKLDLYARHMIPEVWLLDLVAEELLVYRQPQEGRYREVLHPQPGQVVSPDALPEVCWVLAAGKTWSVRSQ